MMDIRLGLAGCGNYGRILARFVREVPGLALVAAADVRPQAIEEGSDLFAGCAVYQSFQAMLQAGGLDAVVIATPNDAHAEQAVMAMRAGLSVYLEKPVACCMQDARRVAQTQNQTGAKLMVGMQLRYGAVFQRAKLLLEQDAIGCVRLLWYREFRAPFLPGEGGWRISPERSGGSIVEKCMHHFDLFNWYAQDVPAAVYCSANGDDIYRDTGMADNALIAVDYRGGARGGLGLSLISRGCDADIDFFVVGSRGVLSIGRDRVVVRPNHGDGGELVYPVEQPFAHMGHGGTEFSALTAFQRYVSLDEPPMTGMREGMLATAMALAAQISAQQGRRVSVSEILGPQGE